MDLSLLREVGETKLFNEIAIRQFIEIILKIAQ